MKIKINFLSIIIELVASLITHKIKDELKDSKH